MQVGLTETSKSLAFIHKYLLLFAAELQRDCLALQDRPRRVLFESFSLFIGVVKPLEQESNHLKQIGNVSAALVKLEERQAQAAGEAGVGEKMLQMQMMEVYFCQGDEK